MAQKAGGRAQYDDTALEYKDLDQQEDSSDVTSGLLFSELFQMCVQQSTVVQQVINTKICTCEHNTINVPMLHAYMQWTHKMTEASGNHEGHSFSVAAVGIMGMSYFLIFYNDLGNLPMWHYCATGYTAALQFNPLSLFISTVSNSTIKFIVTNLHLAFNPL
ncbi:hypothetical protein DFH29DRAFT_872682 [Suillus ampliporus]|nr:hypothetical protein DFH29DRAFT_872682 [Suillus ampliporus]